MTPYYETKLGKLYHGNVSDVLPQFESESVQMCVTSPPDWGLRDYGVDGQLGLEKTPEEYTEKMVQVFREVKRVLRGDGTLWLNLGDSYAGSGMASGRCWEDGKIPNMSKKQGTNTGSLKEKMIIPNGLKPKDLIGIPWRVAFALQADGWYLRQDIIWHKPNPMPESVKDRCTKSHEYMFLMSKNGRYYYDADAIREDCVWDLDGGGTNKRKARQHDGNKNNPDNMINGIRKIKIPGGWDNKPGSHATIHRTGRTEAEYQEAETKNGRNKRSVWTIATQPYSEAHFATFPPKLIEPCIFAGSREGDVVLDPFFGAGTTGLVCEKYGRKWIGIELSESYAEIAAKRIESEASQLKLWG